MHVKGEGDLNAKIYIIGEAPGSQEEASGRPFIGGAGTVLNGLLRKSGIRRADCYVDNVIQDRPSNNDFGIYYRDSKRSEPTSSLMEAHSRIKTLISKYRPNVVVCLGNEALYAVTRHKKILNWRGSIISYNGIKVIPAIHPAMIMREPTFMPIAEMDFRRIEEESKSPKIPIVYNDNFIINPTFDQVIHYLKNILPSKLILTVDIETIPDLEQIMCIGFAWSHQDAICIPIFYGQYNWWTVEEEIAIIKEIRILSQNRSVKFIAQNGQYDMTYLVDKWNANFTLWMDTMLSFHECYSELRKSLAFLTSIYSKRPYYKEDGGKGRDPNEEWEYNCKDCCVTYECAMEIRKEMEEFNVIKHYELIPNRLIIPLGVMQREGILIDVKRRSELDSELEAKIHELQQRLNTAVGREINVNSPKQVKEFLYEDLRLAPIYGWGKKDGKKVKVLSSDEDAIEELQKRTNNPVLGIILEIRGLIKLLGTYVRAELENNNRICTSYKISGTETGRLSSSKSVYNRGTNIQNIPRLPAIRSIFIADPGKILVNADLSQAEARVVAYLAKEERMINVFKSGQDIHRFNAAIIFNVHPNDVTPVQRQTAKNRVHGANYRIGPAKAAKLAGTTEEKAREDLNKYKAHFPNLENWWRDVENEVGKTRVMTNLFGRKRVFFSRWGHELVNEAIAYVPQSTVGDLLNLGLINAWNNLPNGWKISANNHDSILAQVPEGTDEMYIYKFFKYYLEIPMYVHNYTFTIPIDIKMGINWGEMKDLKIK